MRPSRPVNHRFTWCIQTGAPWITLSLRRTRVPQCQDGTRRLRRCRNEDLPARAGQPAGPDTGLRREYRCRRTCPAIAAGKRTGEARTPGQHGRGRLWPGRRGAVPGRDDLQGLSSRRRPAGAALHPSALDRSMGGIAQGRCRRLLHQLRGHACRPARLFLSPPWQALRVPRRERFGLRSLGAAGGICARPLAV